MQRWDAIVIGSGIGGLTSAAIMARMQGWRVLVLERHFRAGGFTHTFERPGGYEWDVGLHYVGDMHPGAMGRQVFDFVTGGGVAWNPMPDEFDRFLYPDFEFSVPRGEANYRSALVQRFPEESAAIARYFRDIHQAANYIVRRIAGNSMPPTLGAVIRWANTLTESLPLMTTAEYLDKHFRDARLKALLASRWADYGLPPAKSAFATHALIVKHYLNGAWYPEGGSGVIAEAASRVIRQAGGEILVNHDVRRILLEGNRAVGVEAVCNRETLRFEAPVIISDAGAWTTYQKLLPAEVSLPFRDELNRSAEGFTNVTVYLGLKRDPRELGLQGENYWIFDGLDHNAMLAGQDDLLTGKAHGCYLSFPSLKNRSAKAHTAEIIAPLSYPALQAFRDQPWRRRSAEYQELKATIAKTLLALVERHHPGFGELVAFQEVSTPLTAELFTGHRGGAIYGDAATPERFRKTWLQPETPIRNLYLTGADAGFLGIMGAMLGGVSAASRLLGPLGFPRITRAAFGASSPSEGRYFDGRTTPVHSPNPMRRAPGASQ